MKKIKHIKQLSVAAFALFLFTSCNDKLNELKENESYTSTTDYTISANMIKPLVGAYTDFSINRGWADFPLISVRGDDVNSGGGNGADQYDYYQTDLFTYNKDYWMYNSVWTSMYTSIYNMNAAVNDISKYVASGADAKLGAQYSAEIKVMQSFLLFNLSRLWGNVFIPVTEQPAELYELNVSTKDEIMQHISADMDVAIPNLPAVSPSERADIKGGITKYTAYAVKALANLELKKYQEVADATAEIIKSNKFSLEPNFFNLWDIHGKLNKENILEWQYSDLGQATGTNYSYLFAFFGPQGWTPAVKGAGDGWGFYEPSLKYIKFMLDRGEKTRLQATVLFTNSGIAEIKKDSKYASLPSWITNTTVYGDVLNDYARAFFASGKYYFPSNELTQGRTDYGTNKNFTCIRYAEILLMYAEALTQGATGSVMTADAAVNLVRTRAGLSNLSGVTNAQVMDEKFAELGTEWGTRFYDMVRLGKTSELTYDGRATYTADKQFLPYPQAQVDLLPGLTSK